MSTHGSGVLRFSAMIDQDQLEYGTTKPDGCSPVRDTITFTLKKRELGQCRTDTAEDGIDYYYVKLDHLYGRWVNKITDREIAFTRSHYLHQLIAKTSFESLTTKIDPRLKFTMVKPAEEIKKLMKKTYKEALETLAVNDPNFSEKRVEIAFELIYAIGIYTSPLKSINLQNREESERMWARGALESALCSIS